MVGPQGFDLSSDSGSSFPKTQRRHFSHAEALESCSFDGMKEILTYSLFLMEYGYEVVPG